MGYTPVFGDQVRFVLLGGVEIGTDTLLRWYVLHVLMLPFVIVIFMAIHFWRVRKDGGHIRPTLNPQTTPTTIPHLNDKRIVNTETMVEIL